MTDTHTIIPNCDLHLYRPGTIVVTSKNDVYFIAAGISDECEDVFLSNRKYSNQSKALEFAEDWFDRRKDDTMTPVIVASFRQGSGTMAMNAIDYIMMKDGSLIKHSWSMGGEEKISVTNIPEHIPGYIKVKP